MDVVFNYDINLIKKIAEIKKINIEKKQIITIEKNAIEKLNFIQNNWNAIERKLKDIFLELIPKEYVDYSILINIYAFPEDISIGACNCEDKKILFGYKEEYKNFSIVTICHEIAHILIYKYRKEGIISRITDEVFAFLIAECEIRRRLNNCRYFEKFFLGKLSELHNYVLKKSKIHIDLWNRYINTSNKNLKKLLETIESSVNDDEKEKYDNMKLKNFL